MRAILINPYNQTVTEVDLPLEDYSAFYDALSEPGAQKVEHFDVLRVGRHGTLYVDDEGHLFPGRACFTYEDYAPDYPLAGRAILCGTNDEGDTLPTSASVADVYRKVGWLDVESTGEFGPSSEGYVEHPAFGRIWQLTGGAPIVRPRKA